jgi:hypothetical protein
MILLHTLITLLIVISFNKIYFFFNKKIIFFKYFIKFNVFTFIIILLLGTFKKDLFINNEYQIIFSALMINYYLFFLSFLLTIGLKSMNSPSYDIYNIIKNNKTTLDILIYKMRKKKIINKRKNDLINQGLIKKKVPELTILGIIVAKFFFTVKKCFNLKLEG